MILFLVILLFVLNVHCVEGAGNTEINYWKDKKRGWYWKEPEKKVEEEKKEPEQYVPVLKQYTVDELWKMHPDQFRELMSKAFKRALQTLSVDDVKEYLIIQDIAQKKASAYMSVAGYLVATTPELNVEKDKPIVYGGRVAQLKLEAEKKRKYLTEGISDFAILYFKKKGCPYCEVMDGVVGNFRKRYPHWQIREIFIDERPDLSSRFNITFTPAFVLLKRELRDGIPFMYGATSLSDFEDALYRSIRFLKGEIGPEEWLDEGVFKELTGGLK